MPERLSTLYSVSAHWESVIVVLITNFIGIALDPEHLIVACKSKTNLSNGADGNRGWGGILEIIHTNSIIPMNDSQVSSAYIPRYSAISITHHTNLKRPRQGHTCLRPSAPILVSSQKLSTSSRIIPPFQNRKHAGGMMGSVLSPHIIRKLVGRWPISEILSYPSLT